MTYARLKYKDQEESELLIDMKGVRNLRKNIQSLFKVKSKAGIFNSRVADYMAFHEKGGIAYFKGVPVFVPRRSWLEIHTNPNSVVYQYAKESMGTSLEEFFEKKVAEEYKLNNVKEVMEAPSQTFVSGVQGYIREGNIKPALSPKTIEIKRQKGSNTPDTPLRDTGEAVDSISYKITGSG